MTSKPRTTHFSLTVPSAVYGVLSTLDDAGPFSLHLERLGFSRPHLLCGQDGLRELDEDGRYHGPLCRLARFLQGLTREREFIETYAAHLYAGRPVLWLHLASTSRLTELKRAFEQHGGWTVLHHSPMVTRVLIP